MVAKVGHFQCNFFMILAEGLFFQRETANRPSSSRNVNYKKKKPHAIFYKWVFTTHMCILQGKHFKKGFCFVTCLFCLSNSKTFKPHRVKVSHCVTMCHVCLFLQLSYFCFFGIFVPVCFSVPQCYLHM
jgi:quinol-cytochrome oxidoreductase complex cytochrome b subunit